MLDRFSSAHGVSKVVRLPNTNRKENIWSFLFCKKVPLSCFYLQLELIIRSTTVNLKCQVSVTKFLEIYWLNGKLSQWQFPTKQRNIFSVKSKNKWAWSLHWKDFSTFIASNPIVTLTKMKNTQKTLKCPKNNFHFARTS